MPLMEEEPPSSRPRVWGIIRFPACGSGPAAWLQLKSGLSEAFIQATGMRIRS